MSAPSLGQFTLHARAVPPLKAGDYVLSGSQDFAAGPVAPYEGHMRVDSPRYAMPPDQILSTFPPANAQGAFEDRLPQAVLRRRTLPWDRRPAPDAADSMPWLTLVVIAEGEGQLSGQTPVAQCVTPGVVLPGTADVPASTYLAVSRTVVDAVFPTAQDVALLAHVRQVDPSDTELSLGDEDGFLAVVMANRLPQYHRSTGPGDPDHPVRYLACLINLEGQLDVLPSPPAPRPTFEAVAYVQNLAEMTVQVDPDHYAMGSPGAGAVAGRAASPRAGADAGTPAARFTGPPPARDPGVSATAQTSSAATWQAVPERVSQVAVSASAQEVGRLVRDTMGLGWRYPVEQIVAEPTYRFPVLAYWSFTVTGDGDFETLMQGLDVGLLGTVPADPPAPPPGTPPPPPPVRPPAELADTGHVGLPHLTRRGDSGRAWYRGPLTPRPCGADPQDPTVRLPLAHASDQLRRITPDGREDVSLAAAFEIGRLLALSQPTVVAAQLRWRAEQFGASRAQQLTNTAVGGLGRFGLSVTAGAHAADLGRLVSRQLVLAQAADRAGALGPSLPLAQPGRPLQLAGDVDTVVASGFGISMEQVRAAADRVGLLAALRGTPVPGPAPVTPGFDERAAAQLRARLSEAVQAMVADVGPAPRAKPPAGPPAGPNGDPGAAQ